MYSGHGPRDPLDFHVLLISLESILFCNTSNLKKGDLTILDIDLNTTIKLLCTRDLMKCNVVFFFFSKYYIFLILQKLTSIKDPRSFKAQFVHVQPIHIMLILIPVTISCQNKYKKNASNMLLIFIHFDIYMQILRHSKM